MRMRSVFCGSSGSIASTVIGPDSEVRLPVPDGADQVMIRLEGRWIARWFELRR